MRTVKRQRRSTPLSESERWRGKIESLSHKGMGVATIEAEQKGERYRRPLFIPFTAPGDEVEASIERARGKYRFGRLEKVLVPSSSRVIPLCPHYGMCGGCNLQHIRYEEQLRQKGLIIAFLLSRRGIALPAPPTVAASAQRSNYRWRTRIALTITDGKITAGFRKARSREIVKIDQCFIVEPRLRNLIRRLNTESLAPPVPAGTVECEIAAAVSRDGAPSILLPLTTLPHGWRPVVKALFERLHDKGVLQGLLVEDGRGVTRIGAERLSYVAAGCNFNYLPGIFIQSNVATDSTLIASVLDVLSRPLRKRKPRSQQVILDLYAGIGNFTLPIAKRFGRCIGVEGDAGCVVLARENAVENAVENASFIHRSVEQYLDALARKAGAKGKVPDEQYLFPDAVVLDPPRTGCSPAVLEGLLRLPSHRIVYVSCNPVTLADDLAVLKEKYEVKDLRAIDMFPDISHVETIVLLERRET